MVRLACSTGDLRLESHMPSDPGLQISFPCQVTLLKSNPKHTQNLKDHHSKSDKDIFILFPKARKENISCPPPKSLT